MDIIKSMNTLPEELVTKMLSFCHYADILRFSMVSQLAVIYNPSSTGVPRLDLQSILQIHRLFKHTPASDRASVERIPNI